MPYLVPSVVFDRLEENLLLSGQVDLESYVRNRMLGVAAVAFNLRVMYQKVTQLRTYFEHLNAALDATLTSATPGAVEYDAFQREYIQVARFLERFLQIPEIMDDAIARARLDDSETAIILVVRALKQRAIHAAGALKQIEERVFPEPRLLRSREYRLIEDVSTRFAWVRLLFYGTERGRDRTRHPAGLSGIGIKQSARDLIATLVAIFDILQEVNAVGGALPMTPAIYDHEKGKVTTLLRQVETLPALDESVGEPEADKLYRATRVYCQTATNLIEGTFARLERRPFRMPAPEDTRTFWESAGIFVLKLGAGVGGFLLVTAALPVSGPTAILVPALGGATGSVSSSLIGSLFDGDDAAKAVKNAADSMLAGVVFAGAGAAFSLVPEVASAAGNTVTSLINPVIGVGSSLPSVLRYANDDPELSRYAAVVTDIMRRVENGPGLLSTDAPLNDLERRLGLTVTTGAPAVAFAGVAAAAAAAGAGAPAAAL